MGCEHELLVQWTQATCQHHLFPSQTVPLIYLYIHVTVSAQAAHICSSSSTQAAHSSFTCYRLNSSCFSTCKHILPSQFELFTAVLYLLPSRLKLLTALLDGNCSTCCHLVSSILPSQFELFYMLPSQLKLVTALPDGNTALLDVAISV